MQHCMLSTDQNPSPFTNAGFNVGGVQSWSCTFLSPRQSSGQLPSKQPRPLQPLQMCWPALWAHQARLYQSWAQMDSAFGISLELAQTW